MLTVTKQNAAAVYAEAAEAGIKASRDFQDKYGDRDACGFAWVVIRPARGPQVTFMKNHDIGSRSIEGGWRIWNPGNAPTQAITIKEKGAQAFADVLERYGIKCFADSRMD